MDQLTNTRLKQLAELEGENLVSIYFPTREPGDDTQQNPIRLKNQLQNIEAKLEERDFSPRAISEYLSPIVELAERDDFWQQQKKSLAIFLSDGQVFYFRLPVEVEESSEVGETLHITPLLQAWRDENKAYLLALSQGKVALYAIESGQLKEIELEDTPTSLDEALQYDDPEKQLQRRSIEAGKGGFHGHGGGEEEKEKNILRFFQMVDKGVRRLIEPEAVLMTAGVEYLHPIYRAANEHPHLMELGIKESVERWQLEELYERARELLHKENEKTKAEALERFGDLSGSEQRVEELEEIVRSAYSGQVETLFLEEGKKVIGEYDLSENQVQIGENDGNAQDLLNLTARFTLLRGGKVYPLPKEKMPVEEGAAAILRY